MAKRRGTDDTERAQAGQAKTGEGLGIVSAPAIEEGELGSGDLDPETTSDP
jgi:hypothetical protein